MSAGAVCRNIFKKKKLTGKTLNMVTKNQKDSSLSLSQWTNFKSTNSMLVANHNII
jgi:predicted nucleotidyltransferase